MAEYSNINLMEGTSINIIFEVINFEQEMFTTHSINLESFMCPLYSYYFFQFYFNNPHDTAGTKTNNVIINSGISILAYLPTILEILTLSAS